LSTSWVTEPRAEDGRYVTSSKRDQVKEIGLEARSIFQLSRGFCSIGRRSLFRGRRVRADVAKDDSRRKGGADERAARRRAPGDAAGGPACGVWQHPIAGMRRCLNLMFQPLCGGSLNGASAVARSSGRSKSRLGLFSKRCRYRTEGPYRQFQQLPGIKIDRSAVLSEFSCVPRLCSPVVHRPPPAGEQTRQLTRYLTTELAWPPRRRAIAHLSMTSGRRLIP
jgi:hypothetical protein